GLALGLLRRLERFLELLPQRLVLGLDFLQRRLGLAARLAHGLERRALRFLEVGEGFLAGALRVVARLLELLARFLEAGERLFELGAALGVLGAGEHAL